MKRIIVWGLIAFVAVGALFVKAGSCIQTQVKVNEKSHALQLMQKDIQRTMNENRVQGLREEIRP